MSHRNRGVKEYVQGAESRRQHLRNHTGEYGYLRNKVILTPDGHGIVLGDTNKVNGSRKLVVKLFDGRVRRYSHMDICRVDPSFYKTFLTRLMESYRTRA